MNSLKSCQKCENESPVEVLLVEYYNSFQNPNVHVLQRENPELYRLAREYVSKNGCLVRDLFTQIEKFGKIQFERVCGECGNPYNCSKGQIHCSKRCRAKALHKNPEFKENYLSKLAEYWESVSFEERSATSKRAFETRRARYSEEELSRQYQIISEKRSATFLKKREAKEKVFLSRLDKILTSGKLNLLVLVMRRISFGLAAYYFRNFENKLSFLEETLGVDLSRYRDKRWMKIYLNGSKKCKNPECETLIPLNSHTEYCCCACNRRDPEARQRQSKISKSLWEDEEYRAKLTTKNDPETEEARKSWGNKVLEILRARENGINDRRDKAIKTKLERGVIVNVYDKSIRAEYRAYKNLVISVTKKEKLKLENLDLVGVHTFHVDHIYPTKRGFLDGIPAELIGNVENLRVLEALENRRKSAKLVQIPQHIQEYIDGKDS